MQCKKKVTPAPPADATGAPAEGPCAAGQGSWGARTMKATAAAAVGPGGREGGEVEGGYNVINDNLSKYSKKTKMR